MVADRFSISHKASLQRYTVVNTGLAGQHRKSAACLALFVSLITYVRRRLMVADRFSISHKASLQRYTVVNTGLAGQHRKSASMSRFICVLDHLCSQTAHGS